MNKKRWFLIGSIAIVIAALIATPFIVKAYQHHQALVKINDTYNESFSRATGYALLAGIEADHLGYNFNEMIMNSDPTSDDIDLAQTKLIATGKYDKLNDYVIKMDVSYTKFMKMSTQNIDQAAEKRAAAKKMIKTVTDFNALVNSPKPTIDYATAFQAYQKQYLKQSDQCTKLLK